MPEEEKDVNAESSTVEEIVVEPAVEEQEAVIPQEPSTQEVKPEVEDDGRPDRNLFWETKRKVDELYPAITAINEKLNSFQQPAQQQQPQYSKAQLRAFAESTDDAAQKTCAYDEIDKIDKTERHNELKQLFEGHTKRTHEEQRRTQAANYVTQNFPDCFVKDGAGNVMGWDNSNPMTRKIGEYMRNPMYAGNPDGLVAAAKNAAYDLGVGMNRKLQSKVTQTNAQLKREQKKQLISGSGLPGQQVEGKSKIAKLAAEYQKTKDPNVFRELAKARGLLPTQK